jgi:hypothetical protein
MVSGVPQHGLDEKRREPKRDGVHQIDWSVFKNPALVWEGGEVRDWKEHKMLKMVRKHKRSLYYN